MFAKPVVFLVHHEEEEQGKPLFIVDEAVSVFDPIFLADFHAALRGHNALVGEVPYIRGAVKRQLHRGFLTAHAIRMFDTQNSIVAFEIEPASAGGPVVQPNFSFSPIKRDSEIGHFLSSVFLPFDGVEGRTLLSDNVSAHFAKLTQNGVNVKAADIPPDSQRIIINDLLETAAFGRPAASLISKEYARLANSPLLRGFLWEAREAERYPINIAFFSKTFSRSTTRFDVYYYDQILNLGAPQTNRILFGLEKAQRDDFIAYPAKDHDERFWKAVTTSQGRNEVIGELRSSLPQHVRLFTENALMSGITVLSADVFRRGEIGWISNKATFAQRDDALWRLTCLHYVLQLGSPVRPSSAHNLSVVSLPFRCSGGIWMCASFLRENVRGTDSDMIDQQGFEQSFLIYHSLLRESERRIRRKAKFAYLRTLGLIAARETRNMRKRSAEGLAAADFGSPCLDETALQAVNRAAVNLARIYPFPVGRIVSKTGNVKLFENPFFDRLTLRSFISKDDIEREIKTGIISECYLSTGD